MFACVRLSFVGACVRKPVYVCTRACAFFVCARLHACVCARLCTCLRACMFVRACVLCVVVDVYVRAYVRVRV